MRFFNTAGPTNAKDHYCIDPLSRINIDDIMMLIEQKKYFVLHAPRQTGKTSCMLALMHHLNKEGKYVCLYANIEAAQGARENVEQAMYDILNELAGRAKYFLKDPFPAEALGNIFIKGGYGTALNQCLTQWSEHLAKPLVLLIDEIDSLIGDTLISVLRQIRSGYDKRPDAFPQSIVLCGVRDIRDYRIHSSREKEIITGGSAFNIKARSLRIGDFNQDEVFSLLDEHIKETGQQFEDKAKELIWYYTSGQPWLVNALAYEVCFEMKEGRDRNKPVTAQMVKDAKENLILRRETHLDQLADKLREERVRRVIEPIINGDMLTGSIPEDDVQYLTDLGLIRRKPSIMVSNPIYMEIIPRMLTSTTQDSISQKSIWYVKPDGTLDMEKLISAFQEFFREHSEHWVERFDYKEAGPQLLMQAFLQRVINSGGQIEREYGLGRMRTDLLVIWRCNKKPDNASLGVEGSNAFVATDSNSLTVSKERVQKIVIELKLLYKSLDKTIKDGVRQTLEYMDRCGTDEGHLIIFDRTEGKSWEEKIFRKEELRQNEKIDTANCTNIDNTKVCKEKKVIIWGM
ncbi:MAG: ATP-binding protein [Desulfamplus sp.]|nr:ATP-binding protein [Desulfamplus sp.]